MYESLKHLFHQLVPSVDFCSLRYVETQQEQLFVRQNVAEPPYYSTDVGAMITIIDKGGMGYAATSDLSEMGLRAAIEQAQQWAQYTHQKMVVDLENIVMPHTKGEYYSQVSQDWNDLSIKDKLTLLHDEAAHCKLNDNIVDWNALLWSIKKKSYYLTNYGGEIIQEHQYLIPSISATANQGINTQTRSFGGHLAYARQGGLEILQQIGFKGQGQRIAEEALQLLKAPNCPTETMDIILMPDQMMLQIHESIGHPLELDRILGDERNYAGTSFVTLDMFGKYQYGSSLLNVTFDPTISNQLATYAFDDEGLKTEKTHIIKEGILQTPLGGRISQERTGFKGVANARASDWNRPPLDRMANLNVEPGDSSLDEMISSIERGVLMKSNVSWSIDDSRNKFQFGCEWGQLIEKGQLTQVVKNPNYRGISATFWRNLKQVGNQDSFDVMGTPNCGKAEPNQVIMVGHASPACHFTDVEVFGGA